MSADAGTRRRAPGLKQPTSARQRCRIAAGCAALFALTCSAQNAVYTPAQRGPATGTPSTQPGGAAGLLAPLPPDAGQLERVAARLGTAFEQCSSAHFIVAHQTTATAAAELLEVMEDVYAAHVGFYDTLGLSPRRPAAKLLALHLPTVEAFETVAHKLGIDVAGSLGLYDERENLSLFFDLQTHPTVIELRAEIALAQPARRVELIRRLETRQQELTRTVIRHELAHQIQANTIGLNRRSAPQWLVEGCAMLFESSSPPTPAGRPAINGYRLREFQELYADPTKLPDLCRFLTDDGAWCGHACYPLAWALTYYLCCEDPAALARLLEAGIAAQNGAVPTGPLSTTLRSICTDNLVSGFHRQVRHWGAVPPADGASVQTRPAAP